MFAIISFLYSITISITVLAYLHLPQKDQNTAWLNPDIILIFPQLQAEWQGVLLFYEWHYWQFIMPKCWSTGWLRLDNTLMINTNNT